jgi:hypothetical protein
MQLPYLDASTKEQPQFNLKKNIFHCHGLEQHTTLGSKYGINLQQKQNKINFSINENSA